MNVYVTIYRQNAVDHYYKTTHIIWIIEPNNFLHVLWKINGY
jgi:hypothetical protein